MTSTYEGNTQGPTHTYVHSLNRETTLTGKHDMEAHEFCTGTHGSCSDWSTSHHLAMHCFVLTQELEEWTKIEDHVI